jgi:predicted RNA binding protein YcfA (HicA-like mRNA interferase family)
VGTATTTNSRQLIKQLESDGWILRGVKGSHHIYLHPAKIGYLSVPDPKNDLVIGLVNKLLKAVVEVPIEQYLGPAEKINITMPKLLLRWVDDYAKEHGMSRSGFLAQAARQAMI